MILPLEARTMRTTVRLAENPNAASIGGKTPARPHPPATRHDKFVGLTQEGDAFVAFRRDDGNPRATRG
jgi:hypothetical protein